MMNQAQQYQRLGDSAKVYDAGPHRLVQIMFEGALARLTLARGVMARGDYEAKSKAIGSVVAIVGGLQDCLDMEKGGELATNLNALYDYIQRRLFRAGIDNDVAMIDEVRELLMLVKEGWDGIDPNAVAKSE